MVYLISFFLYILFINLFIKSNVKMLYNFYNILFHNIFSFYLFIIVFIYLTNIIYYSKIITNLNKIIIY